MSVETSFDGWRGERDESLEAADLEAAIRAHDDDGSRVLLKSDDRSLVTAVPAARGSFVVKEVRKGGLRRRVADAFRGSPARRAFRAGHRLAGRGIGVARPLAFLERRRLGVPFRSLLVSQDLRAHPTADRSLASAPAVLELLADLLIALHRDGVVHGDLRVQHVHLCRDGDTGPVLRLVDLEGVRFHASLRDADRIEDLAQLNASIADDLATPEQRRAAFARYARALPFDDADDAVIRSIAARSVARGHLFQGRACAATDAP